MIYPTIMLAIAFLLLVQKLAFSAGELFTSNAHLQTALYAERDIARVLLTYVEQEEARIDKIRQLANDYKVHSSKALENIDQYLGNPFNAFLLIKRFTLDWDRDVGPVLANNTWESLKEEIDQIRTDLPSHEDLKGAASALMRLQDTYHLDTTKMAHGDLAGLNSPILSDEECFELGRLSYNEGDYYHTVLWMKQALLEHDARWSPQDGPNKHLRGEMDNDNEDKEMSHYNKGRSELLDYLAFSHYKLGDIQLALDLTNELLRIDPNHERAVNNKKYFETMVQDENRKKGSQEESTKPGYMANRDEYRNSEEFLKYEALCRGEDIMPIKHKDKFSCRYVTNNHPLLLLRPAKEETMHLDPWIVVYHDVMNDEEIRQIKHLATPRLNRATVQNSKTGALETASYRISKSAWLKDGDHPVVARINHRMAAITGLEMATAEELQIANYGLGGHYEPHFDFARNRKANAFEQQNGNRIATFLNYKEEKDAFKSLGTGNRVATFLNYLSDVEAGGATVFPYLGLKLFPQKGNAAFWYNLYKNGDGIYNTRHAACPVLVGTKWVANKWIHERGQEFRRPCGLEADE